MFAVVLSDFEFYGVRYKSFWRWIEKLVLLVKYYFAQNNSIIIAEQQRAYQKFILISLSINEI